MKETVTLAALHEAVLLYLVDRKDTVVFGAQAVNAYIDEARMTEDVDIMALDATSLAHDLRQLLADQFHIAVRVREVIDGRAFRVFQLRTPKNRHLVDVRGVTALPPHVVIAGVQVPTPEELIAEKVISWTSRRKQPKGGTDWRDIAMLLLRFPEFQAEDGAVSARMRAAGASDVAVATWTEVCSTHIEPPADDDTDFDL